MSFLKKYAIQIAIVVAAAILAAAIYDTFLSSNAKVIRYLEGEIKKKDEQIAELKKEYQELTEEEEQRLQEIARLRETLGALRDQIAQGEADINAINSEIIELDEAITIIEQNTRSTVNRSRGVLSDERADRAN